MSRIHHQQHHQPASVHRARRHGHTAPSTGFGNPFLDLFQSGNERHNHGTYGPRMNGRYHSPGTHRVRHQRTHHATHTGSHGHARTHAVRVRHHGNVQQHRLDRAHRNQAALRHGSAQEPVSHNRIASNARSWNHRSFKPGQKYRCADWVSTVLRQSGAHVRHSTTAAGLAGQGQGLNRSQLRPGDTVLFGNTYRRGRYTHVGIYIGNGQFIHRPTANRPVALGNLNSRYWSTHFSGARRIS